MIVCLCHRISDRDIVDAVHAGIRCFDSLQDETRVASSCASCHDCAVSVFERACAATALAGARESVRRIEIVAAERR